MYVGAGCTLPNAREGVPLTQTTLCTSCTTRVGWPFCRILETAKDTRRQLGNPWPVLTGFLSSSGINMLHFLSVPSLKAVVFGRQDLEAIDWTLWFG